MSAHLTTQIIDKPMRDMSEAWRKARGWPEMPDHAMPAMGVMCFVSGVPAASCFLYRTDSSVGIMEWLTTNPELDGDTRSIAQDHLIESIELAAKTGMGMKYIFSFCSHKPLIDRLQRKGFLKTDENMTHFVKVLGD